MSIIVYPQNQIKKFLFNVQSTDQYKHFLEDFKRRGLGTVKYENTGILINIYAPVLAYVLTLNERIPTDNYENGSKETIETTEYLAYFYEGFVKGLKMFQDEFTLKTDTIYSSDISDYLEDLKLYCFKSNIRGYKKGWSFVRLHSPLTFKKELIEEYGYYSGLVKSVDELIEKKPERFKELIVAKNHFLNCFQGLNGERIIAGASIAVRAVKHPDFLKDENVIKRRVIELEQLMFDDSKKLNSIEEFKSKTRYVFELINSYHHNELLEYLVNHATDHLSTKKAQIEEGTGKYIDANQKQIGSTTIQTEWKKTPKENIRIKVNTLGAYLQWLTENYKESSSSQHHSENVRDNKLQINKHEKIFCNDLGYTLFLEWFEQHKDEDKDLANFSFIFLALERDDLVVCTQSDFVNFLSQIDPPIIIDKVDSRQSGESNKKYKLYKSNKMRYAV